MTRKNTLISVLSTVAMTLGIGSSAIAAEYDSVNATLGDQSAGYSSPNAIVGDQSDDQAPTVASKQSASSLNALIGDGGSVRSASAPLSPSSLNSIVGSDGAPRAVPVSVATSSPNAVLGSEGLTRPSLVGSESASSSDGFNWGDALIGAGVTFGLILTTALLLGMSRRRTRVEPSV